MRRLSLLTLVSALLCTLLVSVSACDGGHRVGTATPSVRTATPSLSGQLPRFADWHVAYLTGDLRLHAVSWDGTSDVAGPSLPGLTGFGSQHLGVTAGGFSPDGRLLAYEGADGLYVSDATGTRAPAHVEHALAYTQVWSADSTLLAYLDGLGAVKVLHLGDGRLAPVPLSSSLAVTQLVGWTDATHLTVIAAPPYHVPTPPPDATPVSSGSGGVTSVALYVLDIASGALRPLVTLSSSTMGIPSFSLSPEGTTLLYFNRPFRDHPFVADVALIDVATGTVTHRPHIASAAGGDYTGVSWLRGTPTIAVSQGFYLTGQFKTWLLDTARDTATPLAATAGVAAGWVPGTRTLILTSGTPDSTAIGVGPYTISAVPDPLANPASDRAHAHDECVYLSVVRLCPHGVRHAAGGLQTPFSLCFPGVRFLCCLGVRWSRSPHIRL